MRIHKFMGRYTDRVSIDIDEIESFTKSSCSSDTPGTVIVCKSNHAIVVLETPEEILKILESYK